MIGSYGNINFVVSDREVLTLKNVQRQISGTWNQQNRIGQKPVTSFGGAALQALSLTITLDASLGVRPREVLEQLERIVESGEVHDLVIGQRKIGGKFSLISVTENWKTILSQGELLRAEVTIKLQEYV